MKNKLFKTNCFIVAIKSNRFYNKNNKTNIKVGMVVNVNSYNVHHSSGSFRALITANPFTNVVKSRFSALSFQTDQIAIDDNVSSSKVDLGYCVFMSTSFGKLRCPDATVTGVVDRVPSAIPPV